MGEAEPAARHYITAGDVTAAGPDVAAELTSYHDCLAAAASPVPGVRAKGGRPRIVALFEQAAGPSFVQCKLLTECGQVG